MQKIFDMDFSMGWIAAIAGLLGLILLGLIWMEQMKIKKSLKAIETKGSNHTGLILQAYERLTLFAERVGLKQLITRVQPVNDSAASMHIALIEEIKSEYNYNVSQQIYVAPEIWQAVTRLKDQNIYVINQIAGSLPFEARANELSKAIMEFSSQENAELNTVVMDAIQFEAKKIL